MKAIAFDIDPGDGSEPLIMMKRSEFRELLEFVPAAHSAPYDPSRLQVVTDPAVPPGSAYLITAEKPGRDRADDLDPLVRVYVPRWVACASIAWLDLVFFIRFRHGERAARDMNPRDTKLDMRVIAERCRDVEWQRALEAVFLIWRDTSPVDTQNTPMFGFVYEHLTYLANHFDEVERQP